MHRQRSGEPQFFGCQFCHGTCPRPDFLIIQNQRGVILARDVKFYAENAIRLDPNNFRAYHILGRWNYDVSNLNMAEKSFARVFYGKLPDASLDEAIADFDKSRSLYPGIHSQLL